MPAKSEAEGSEVTNSATTDTPKYHFLNRHLADRQSDPITSPLPAAACKHSQKPVFAPNGISNNVRRKPRNRRTAWPGICMK
jgi:hypothetical protein